MDDHPLGIAHHHVAGKHRDVAAADRHVDVQRLVQGQVGRGRRAVVVGREGQGADLGRIAKAAIGDDATRPRFISRVTRIAPAEAVRGFLRLSITSTAPSGHWSTADALRMAGIAEHREGVQVLPGGM